MHRVFIAIEDIGSSIEIKIKKHQPYSSRFRYLGTVTNKLRADYSKVSFYY
jgi:hypothetical protein